MLFMFLFVITMNTVVVLCQRRNNEYFEEIPGEAGLDYPVLASVPDTDFSCDNRVSGGYYADTQTACQVFHVCLHSGSSYFGLIKYSFVCPNGTMFQQKYFTCDWWYNVDCGASQDYYDLNNNLFKEQQQNVAKIQSTTEETQQDLASYGNNKRGGKGKGNPVRISINRDAEYLPFPNFPSQNTRLRSERLNSQSDALYGNKRILFLNDRFPRDYDPDKRLNDDDIEEAFDEEDFDYIDYSEVNKPFIEK